MGAHDPHDLHDPDDPHAAAGTPAVVLLSGGLDSATALAVAQADGFAGHALSLDYGQRHRVELDAATRVAQHLGAAAHRIVAVDLRAMLGCAASALTGAIDVPKNRAEAGIGAGIPVTYVPARNMLLLSLAAGYAETISARDIYIGTNIIDYSGYPDCRPEFIRAFEHAARQGTRAGAEGRPLRIRTPLAELSKADIIRLGTRLGVDYTLTVSCYDPATDESGTVLACGRCDACLLRRRGFAEAGVADPTLYVEGVTA